MAPTAVLLDTINIPGHPELSRGRPILLQFKEMLGDLQDNLPADHELDRWIEATSVSIQCPPVEKEMIEPSRAVWCSGRSEAVRAALQEECQVEEGEKYRGDTELETSSGHQRFLPGRLSLL